MAQIFQSDRARARSQTAGKAGIRREGPQDAQLSALQKKADAGRTDPISGQPQILQRQVEEEEPLQGRADGPALQRQEEEEALQGKAAEGTLQRASDEESVQMKSAGGGTPLPRQLQSGVEALSGQSMDHVRVHRNSDKPAAVGAHAYAQGSDIHLAPGQEKHLPHEAWHTVQQAEGRVPSTTEVGGVPVNDSPALEHEADKMGNKASGK